MSPPLIWSVGFLLCFTDPRRPFAVHPSLGPELGRFNPWSMVVA